MSSASERPADAAVPPVMAHAGGTWIHRIARALVRPLVATPVTPNQVTTARLVTGLAALAAIALGTPQGMLWGGILWIVSGILDRADGELARMSGKTSAWGHTYDFVCDTVITPLFFVAAGIGVGGGLALALGIVAGGAILVSNIVSEMAERRMPRGGRIHEGAGGFDLDDLLFLLAPAAWLGWLFPLLVLAAIGASVMLVLTLLKARKI